MRPFLLCQCLYIALISKRKPHSHLLKYLDDLFFTVTELFKEPDGLGVGGTDTGDEVGGRDFEVGVGVVEPVSFGKYLNWSEPSV